MRRNLITAAVFSGMLVCAPGASASTVSQNGRTVSDSVGETNSITLTKSGATAVITDGAGLSITASPSCTQDTPTQVTCTAAQGVQIAAGPGNDQVTLVGTQDQMGVEISGGTGDDRIDASGATSPFGFILSGYEGNDIVIAGNAPGPPQSKLDEPAVIEEGIPSPGSFATNTRAGAGNDTLTGGPGAELINAGPGADVVQSGDGPDVINTGLATLDPRLPGAVTYTADDRAVDVINCGPQSPVPGNMPGDFAQIFAGDQVGLDCEYVRQSVSCPEGSADCEGAVTITAPVQAGASIAAKGKKGKAAVLGKSRNLKLDPGDTESLTIKLKTGTAKKALGKRSQVGATMNLGLNRVKKGKTVGRTKKRIRFKLKR